ncbi:MAG TPA: hypothetical protein VFV99_21525, partial [Kofleriaceae bacterium]|nr:hypothetical protein [Kofleriaceae bacterium]
MAACAAEDDKAPGEWAPGKGDGAFELVEVGPAPLDARVDIALDHRVFAYRVESYGGTKLKIDLKGRSTDAYLIVEGPLAGDGDRLAIGAGTVIGEDDDSGYGRDARLELELAEPGVYRILTGTYESLGEGGAASGSLTLTVACSANCSRPMVDQKNFVRALQQQAGPAFTEYAKAELTSLVHDPAIAEQMTAQLTAILADPQLTGLERFPTIPLAAIGALRPALGQIPAQPASEDKVVTGDLMQLLGGCTPDRSLPAEVDARLPGVRYGQFPSKTLSPCQFAHASKLAQVLTSLAAQNGSSVTFKGQTIKTPRELFAALIASGHTIEVRNERMYANFLSMIAGDRDVIWPVWLDTGIKLSNGESLSIPVGHSHHAWRITGPNINTRVMFYLGISGAGFFGQTDQRPAWSGTVASTDITVTAAQGADHDYLLKTADAAATYLRRNRVERTTVAQGMPADGYGYVGVCNDSNAAIEHATKGTITAFPLLRAKELDAQADLGDGLDATIKALPKDGDGIANQRDALRRAVAMQPFANGSPLIWDPKLAAQLATARADLGQ